MLIVFSNTSLVVPATSLTIARSCFNNVLKRVDFPAFVGPARTTVAPAVNTLTASKPSIAELRAITELSIFFMASPTRFG